MLKKLSVLIAAVALAAFAAACSPGSTTSPSFDNGGLETLPPLETVMPSFDEFASPSTAP